MSAITTADTVGVRADDPTLTAAADAPFAPDLVNPPADWFFEPPAWFDDTTKIWIDSDGRAAGWYYQAGVCIIDGNENQCWMPPASPTGNEMFHQGSVLALDQGTPVVLEVGVIGGGGDHAPAWMTPEQAATYYQDVDKQRLVGRIYDDPNKGGYFLGAVLPSTTVAQVASIRRSALSGDWRYRRTDLAGHRLNGYDSLGPWLVTRPGLPINRMGYQVQRLAAAGAGLPDGHPVMVGSVVSLPESAESGYSAPMPWHIEHSATGYDVVNTRTGHVEGEHPTADDARQQLAALYAAEPQAAAPGAPCGCTEPDPEPEPQGAPAMTVTDNAAPAQAAAAAPPEAAAVAPPAMPPPAAPPADATHADPTAELSARLDAVESRLADCESMIASMATDDLQVTDLLDPQDMGGLVG